MRVFPNKEEALNYLEKNKFCLVRWEENGEMMSAIKDTFGELKIQPYKLWGENSLIGPNK